MPSPPFRSRARDGWTPAERRFFAGLRTPHDVQTFLDSIPYSAEERYRAPRSVIRDRVAHCFDGAVFAAAAMRMMGRPAVILDMHAVRDDDHVIALYRERDHIGAVAKSNTSVLRFREPVYRSVRELVMSYFDGYFNVDGERTLREYTVPLRLSRFDKHAWMTDDDTMELIADTLSEIKTYPVLTPAMARALHKIDQRLLDAGFLGANVEGLYVP